MGGQQEVEHPLDINDVYILLKLVRNAIDRQIQERPESINEPDYFDKSRSGKKLSRMSRL
jgi:hypothetical protein